jgi:hypothetical protein
MYMYQPKLCSPLPLQAAVVFGEQVFPGESLLVVPGAPSSTLTAAVAPARDAAVMLLIKALVGSRTSNVYQVRSGRGWGGAKEKG